MLPFQIRADASIHEVQAMVHTFTAAAEQLEVRTHLFLQIPDPHGRRGVYSSGCAVSACAYASAACMSRPSSLRAVRRDQSHTTSLFCTPSRLGTARVTLPAKTRPAPSVPPTAHLPAASHQSGAFVSQVMGELDKARDVMTVFLPSFFERSDVQEGVGMGRDRGRDGVGWRWGWAGEDVVMG